MRKRNLILSYSSFSLRCLFCLFNQSLKNNKSDERNLTVLNFWCYFSILNKHNQTQYFFIYVETRYVWFYLLQMRFILCDLTLIILMSYLCFSIGKLFFQVRGFEMSIVSYKFYVISWLGQYSRISQRLRLL